MNRLEEALAALHLAFEQVAIPYMVIGGLANAQWGVPRATLDVDVSVWVEEEGLVSTVDGLCARFRPLARDPAALVRQARVLPVDVGGVRADIIFALLPYEREAIRRAVPRPAGGCPVRFCTAEDLILHKVVSDRDKDRDDVRGIFAAQRGKLDTDYLEPRLRELAGLLGRPAIWEEYLRNR